MFSSFSTYLCMCLYQFFSLSHYLSYFSIVTTKLPLKNQIRTESPWLHTDTFNIKFIEQVSLSPWWAIATPHLCRSPSNTSSCVANRVFVLWSGVRPEPLRWESQVQDTDLPETSQAHIISTGKRSARDPHINAKTQLHPMASKFQCWTPYAKQLARQEHNPTH